MSAHTLKYFSFIICFGLLCGSSTKEAWADDPEEGLERKLSALENFPKKAEVLFSWPSETMISGTKHVTKDRNINTLRAYRTSLGWIEKVISPNWLPIDPNYLKNNLIMIEDEYGLIDATHVRWEHNGYAIEITQTQTVFAVKLTPLGTVTVADTSTAKKQLARAKCSEILAEYADVEIRKPVDSEIVKKNIKPIILKSSVDEAYIYDSNDITYSTCKKLNINDKEDKFNFDYWWRRINWWTNGKSIGIYTLKTEGGAWSPNYESKLDEKWFSGEITKRKAPAFKPPKPGSPGGKP